MAQGPFGVTIGDRSDLVSEATLDVAGVTCSWYSADVKGQADERGILHTELPEGTGADEGAALLTSRSPRQLSIGA